MDPKRLPLEFGNIPLGSLYEESLVEDLLLLVDVVCACRDGDDAKLAELGVVAGPAAAHTEQSPDASREADDRGVTGTVPVV
jgi:hypothetical protein